MKKALVVVLSLALANLPSLAMSADTKFTGMTEATSLSSTDIVPVVINPGSSPANRKATLSTLGTSLVSLVVDTVTSKSSGATLTKAEFCNGYIRATATETLTYPTITSDMVGCKTTFIVQGAYTLSVDVPVAVTPTLNGTALTAGNKVANSGFSGEAIEAVVASTTSVEFTNKGGTWIDNGA